MLLRLQNKTIQSQRKLVELARIILFAIKNYNQSSLRSRVFVEKYTSLDSESKNINSIMTQESG